MSLLKNRKTHIFLSLLVITVGFRLLLSYSPRFLLFYENSIFYYLQLLRSRLLNSFTISVGDFIYAFLIVLLLFFLLRLVYTFITFRKNKKKIWGALYRLSVTATAIYLSFLLLWGGNYSRKNITEGWTQKDSWTQGQLLALNQFLLDKLNTEVTQLPAAPVTDNDAEAVKLYQKHFGTRFDYMKIKASTLGNWLNYMGVQGYYNPLSGEGQFNEMLPDFMHPFVITHEMAHQTGIAAEDNANLMAYIICSESTNARFRYSAYFNIFLYSLSELKNCNKDLADQLLVQLNSTSKRHIEELKALRKRYKGIFRGLSLGLYNQYLVWQGQQKGLDSYHEVTRWVYIWENGQKGKTDGKLCLY